MERTENVKELRLPSGLPLCEDCRSPIDQEEAVTVIRSRAATSRFCSERCAAASLNPDWWLEIGVGLPE